MKIQKKIFSMIAMILVIILTLPTVVKAENSFEFTTYECIKDNYTEGSWQDKSLIMAYSCTNAMYERYAPYLKDFPFDINSYDYYVFWVKGYEIGFCGINTSDYAFLTYGPYTYGDFATLEEGTAVFNIQYEARMADIEANDYSMLNSILIFTTGTWNTWKVNTGTDGAEWYESVATTELDYDFTSDFKGYSLSASGVLINTNIDLYSSYEYWALNPSDGTDSSNNLSNDKADYIYNTIQGMEILNTGLKYYDGENILGGAPTFDLSLGFSDFDMYKINHPDIVGGIGCRLDWTLTPETLENINPEWKIKLDFTITYSIYETKENNYVDDKTTFERDVLYDTQIIELNDYVTQEDDYLYDFVDCYVEQNNGAGFIFEALRNSHYENVGSEVIRNIDDKIAGATLGALDPSQICPFIAEYYYGFEYIQVSVVGRLINETNNTMSNSFTGYVDIKTGDRSGFVSEVVDDSEVVNPETQYDDSNYYNVVTETDSNGNTYYNYYYYDTTNNTVTPSIGSSDTVNMILTFANELKVSGIEGGGSSSSSAVGSGDNINLTIEDDDYTDTALREDLKNGFGLLDNNDTEELDDGFLPVVAAFFNSLDSDASDMIMFGLASVVVISIIKTALK